MKVHSILYYLSFVSYETKIILKNITFANVAQFVLFNNHVNGGTCEGFLTGLILSVVGFVHNNGACSVVTRISISKVLY